MRKKVALDILKSSLIKYCAPIVNDNIQKQFLKNISATSAVIKKLLVFKLFYLYKLGVAS